MNDKMNGKFAFSENNNRNLNSAVTGSNSIEDHLNNTQQNGAEIPVMPVFTGELGNKTSINEFGEIVREEPEQGRSR